MFEAQLAYYLNRYIGAYVQGLDTQSLKISVFKGDVVLRNLKLKPEALADLNLPITVKAGLLGSLTLKVIDCIHVDARQPRTGDTACWHAGTPSGVVK